VHAATNFLLQRFSPPGLQSALEKKVGSQVAASTASLVLSLYRLELRSHRRGVLFSLSLSPLTARRRRWRLRRLRRPCPEFHLKAWKKRKGRRKQCGRGCETAALSRRPSRLSFPRKPLPPSSGGKLTPLPFTLGAAQSDGQEMSRSRITCCKKPTYSEEKSRLWSMYVLRIISRYHLSQQ